MQLIARNAFAKTKDGPGDVLADADEGLFVEGIVTGDPFQPAQGSLSVASKGKVAAITATPLGGQS